MVSVHNSVHRNTCDLSIRSVSLFCTLRVHEISRTNSELVLTHYFSVAYVQDPRG